jgi:hypothetical protein
MAHSIRFHLPLLSLIAFTSLNNLNANSHEVAESETKFGPISAGRDLESFTPKLKIKLTKPQYITQSPVVVLQDPCSIESSLVCIRNPTYIESQIPQPLKIPGSSSIPDSEIVYEYSGYYTFPISLDIYYHTPGSFTLDKFSDSTLVNLSSTMTALYLIGTEDATSSFVAYGYLKGPKDGNINFSFSHDDSGTIWINENLIYQKDCCYGDFNFRFTEDLLYFVTVKVDNIGRWNYLLDLKWNLSDTSVQVDSSYMTNPVRISGMPYLLENLKYNTFCDDSNGFSCVKCDGLCIDCEENSSMKVCTSCKENANLSNGQCSCKPTFYLSSSDPEICRECIGLCYECKKPNIDIECITCQPNSSLDELSGRCVCNDEYYLSASSSRECFPCNPLCSKCKEIFGSQVCTECKDFARLEYDDCKCIEGYYHHYYDSNSRPFGCYECPLNCETCEEDSNWVYCTSCKENAILYQGICNCIEGYYLYDEITYDCKSCKGLCKTCNSLECLSCVENAELVDRECSCIQGYYKSSTDPYACTPCMNEFCKTCQEEAGEYKCTSCTDPYILSETNICICNEEYYYTKDKTCIYIEFSLELIPSLNKLELIFNQSMKKSLLFQDLNHQILDREISYKLTANLYTIEDKLVYEISYNSTYSIQTNITVSLAIDDSVQNLLNKPLNDLYYEVNIPIILIGSNLYDDMPNNDSKIDTNDTATEALDLNISINSLVVIAVSTVAAVNLMNSNINSVWIVLNTIQIFSYSILLNIKIPTKISYIAQGMSFNFIPNIFEYFIKYKSRSTPKRYEEMGFDSPIYLLNNGDLFTILVINIAFYLILKLLYVIFKGRDGKCLSITAKGIVCYEWSFYSRFVIQSYLDIAVAASFTLKYIPKGIEIVDYIVAAISYVRFT